MRHGIHFISGLPRSGSTLLSAILRQNPKFHAAMSSPVAPLVGMLQHSMSARNEFHVFINDAIRRNVLRAAFEAYYSEVGRDKLVFDTGRAWCSKLHLLHELYPTSKIICCVRNLAWVFDSIERIVRENPLEPSKMFTPETGANVYSRVEALSAPRGMVGSALNGLREAFYAQHADKLLVVPYDTLVADPCDTLKDIYEFLNEPFFQHDFEHVEYEADNFDLFMGAPGLHKVSGRVEKRERAMVLPPDLAQRFDRIAFWMDPQRNPRNVRVLIGRSNPPKLDIAAE